METKENITTLAAGDADHQWWNYPWTHFVRLEKPEEVLCVQPVHGWAAWAGDLPLDAEEVVASAVMEEASRRLGATPPRFFMPPFRHTPVVGPEAAFSIDPEDAFQVLLETLRSAALCGVRRFILFNSSPLLEDWVDIAARDSRIDFDLQMFCLNLSGAGLDFDADRRKPESDPTPLVKGILEQTAGGAPLCGWVAEKFSSVADSLASILREIAAHPPLPENLRPQY